MSENESNDDEEVIEPDVYEVESKESKGITLDRLFKLYKKGRLTTDTYQRNFVDRKSKWNTKLMESLICGIDIGSVEIVKEETDEGEMYYIVDGQHRIMTVMRYMDGEFTLSKNHLTKVNQDKLNKRFQKLPERWQNKLEETEILAFMYRENEHHDAASIFLRRNEGSTNLNKMERLNAGWCRSPSYQAMMTIANTTEWQDYALSNNDRLEALRILLELLKDSHRFESGEDITKTESEVTHFNENLANISDEKEIKKLKRKVENFLELWRAVAGSDKINNSKTWDCTDEAGNKPHRIVSPTLSIVIEKLVRMNKVSSIEKANLIRDTINELVVDNCELFFPVGDTRKFTVNDSTIRILSSFLLEEIVAAMEADGVVFKLALPVSKKLRKEILSERKDGDHWVCEISGVKLINEKDIDIDHIVKRSLGGKTEKDNLRVVHKSLNRSQRYNFLQVDEEE